MLLLLVVMVRTVRLRVLTQDPPSGDSDGLVVGDHFDAPDNDRSVPFGFLQHPGVPSGQVVDASTRTQCHFVRVDDDDVSGGGGGGADGSFHEDTSIGQAEQLGGPAGHLANDVLDRQHAVARGDLCEEERRIGVVGDGGNVRAGVAEADQRAVGPDSSTDLGCVEVDEGNLHDGGEFIGDGEIAQGVGRRDAEGLTHLSH